MVVDCMVLEPEIKEVLDEHDNRLQKLEVDSEVMKEKWNNISTQLTRIENNALSSNNALLASNNAVLQTLSQVVNNATQINSDNTELTKTKFNNKKDIIIKVLGILGACLAGWLAAKYGLKITL